jgi:hypothetical protein
MPTVLLTAEVVEEGMLRMMIMIAMKPAKEEGVFMNIM